MKQSIHMLRLLNHFSFCCGRFTPVRRRRRVARLKVVFLHKQTVCRSDKGCCCSLGLATNTATTPTATVNRLEMC